MATLTKLSTYSTQTRDLTQAPVALKGKPTLPWLLNMDVNSKMGLTKRGLFRGLGASMAMKLLTLP